MITAPLITPRKGDFVFSDALKIMAQVTKVTHDGFAFHVLNGNWDGRVRDGEVMIDGDPSRFATPRLGEADFAEVLSVTAEEYHAWHMTSAPGAARLVKRGDAATVGPGAAVEGDEEDGPDPVYEVTLRVSVLGQAESAQELENWVAGLSLEDLAREMDQGELIGASQVIGTSKIPPGDLRTRLEEIGNDGSFFEGVDPASKAVPVARRISEIRDQQGWNDGSMEHLAAEFIREAGLEQAFLTHLERQAEMENAYSEDGPGLT